MEWRKHAVFTRLQVELLGALAAKPTRKAHVSHLDRHTFCVKRTFIDILEEMNEVRFSGLLQGRNSTALPFISDAEFLGDLLYKSEERELSNEQVG